MRFPCCFCCLKWGKISPSAVTCCERKLRFFGEMLFFFCHSFLFYIFFGCCCFTVFPNCYWSSWWSRKRQCRCIWRKTMLNGCVANSPASTVKPNLVFWLTGFAVKIIVLRNLGNHHFLGFCFVNMGCLVTVCKGSYMST